MTKEDRINSALELISKIKPFPIGYFDDLKYDDVRLRDDYPEKERVRATFARDYLLENGYSEEELSSLV
jgi:hypothetical protein